MLRNRNSADIFYNKTYLLVLIATVVTSLLTVPVILPHLFHQHMIYHILLHIVSLIISQFLAIVSLLAYARTKSGRILFMTLGFLTLVAVECIYLLHSTENTSPMFIPYLNIEVSHVVLLIMVIFFGISILKGANDVKK